MVDERIIIDRLKEWRDTAEKTYMAIAIDICIEEIENIIKESDMELINREELSYGEEFSNEDKTVYVYDAVSRETIEAQEEVKAIPIKFIEEALNERRDQAKKVLEDLLREWENADEDKYL